MSELKEGFYLLKNVIEAEPTHCYGYSCSDLDGAFVFGFNIYDGAGLVAADDLLPNTTVTEATLIPTKKLEELTSMISSQAVQMHRLREGILNNFDPYKHPQELQDQLSALAKEAPEVSTAKHDAALLRSASRMPTCGAGAYKSGWESAMTHIRNEADRIEQESEQCATSSAD